MNAGKLDKKITIMQYIQDASGDFALLPSRRIWAQVVESAGNCVYSNFAFGVKAVEIHTRVTVIPNMTFIAYNGNNFIVTSCITDGFYNTITAAKVTANNCTVSRYSSVYDELRRPCRTLVRLFTFPGILGEKYVRAQEFLTHSETINGVILTTPKCIVLQEGDVICASGTSYIVKSVHVMDADKNDYNLEKKGDV